MRGPRDISECEGDGTHIASAAGERRSRRLVFAEGTEQDGVEARQLELVELDGRDAEGDGGGLRLLEIGVDIGRP
jgi:hypothetical protein